jgi:hypothetical protein
MFTRVTIWLAVLTAGTACGIKVNTVNIGQKTSLEKQLMGEVEPLTEEQMLVASVRAPGGVQIGSRDELQMKAIAARRRQLFNRDDIDELKSAGCLGEALSAKLVARPCERTADQETAALREQLIAQERADRRAIIDWAIGTDPLLTAADRPQLVDLYHRLVLERANPGDSIQQPDGTWSNK